MPVEGFDEAGETGVGRALWMQPNRELLDSFVAMLAEAPSLAETPEELEAAVAWWIQAHSFTIGALVTRHCLRDRPASLEPDRFEILLADTAEELSETLQSVWSGQSATPRNGEAFVFALIERAARRHPFSPSSGRSRNVAPDSTSDWQQMTAHLHAIFLQRGEPLRRIQERILAGGRPSEALRDVVGNTIAQRFDLDLLDGPVQRLWPVVVVR